jgi:hypothetical protein
VPIRVCETCGRSFTQGRGRPSRFCPAHRDGGGKYGGEHRKLRETTKDQAWGYPCTRCGRVLVPGQEIHLDHLDGGGPADYRGWAHASCNMSAGAAKGNRMRGQLAPGGMAAARVVSAPVPPVYEPGSIRHRPDCACGGRVTWWPGEWWTSRCW